MLRRALVDEVSVVDKTTSSRPGTSIAFGEADEQRKALVDLFVRSDDGVFHDVLGETTLDGVRGRRADGQLQRGHLGNE